jgi:hypothetical protein
MGDIKDFSKAFWSSVFLKILTLPREAIVTPMHSFKIAI